MAVQRIQHHTHTFWTSGSLRCVLVTAFGPTRCEVRLLNNSLLFLAEQCVDADEAAVVAERLWREFVDTVN